MHVSQGSVWFYIFQLSPNMPEVGTNFAEVLIAFTERSRARVPETTRPTGQLLTKLYSDLFISMSMEDDRCGWNTTFIT